MSTPQAKVDIRKVIEAFNQSEEFPFKLNPKGANFSNVTLELDDIKWSNNTFDVKEFKGFSRTVNVNTTKSTTTTVSASPDAYPGSQLNICTGYVEGFGSPNVKAWITLPREFGSLPMQVDLTKQVQEVKLSEARYQGGKPVAFPSRGKASVTSNNTVYQGSFAAKAHLRGPVIFQIQGGQGVQQNIEELARAAAPYIPKPFSYDPSANALCWTVTGMADFLLENITVVRGQ